MEIRCPACGMNNPEGCTVCPCGTPLVRQDETDLQTAMAQKRKNALLWLGIVAIILTSIFLLRFRNSPPSAPPATGAAWKPEPYLGPEKWETRNLKDARITLSAPGPFRTYPIEAFGLPDTVRPHIARADFYYFFNAELEVLAGRMQSSDPGRIPPAPIPSFPTRQDGTGPNIQTGLCMAGSRGGNVFDMRLEDHGESIVARSYVFEAPPELWLISIRHLDRPSHAVLAAQRIADSIRIDGDPVLILQSPAQSLTGDWRDFPLVHGLLTASAPQPWTPIESAALDPGSQLPFRCSGERYFLCQVASTTLIVGTGTCDQDQGGYIDAELSRPPEGLGPSGQAPAPVPKVAILLGRRAAEWESPFAIQKEERVLRKVIAVDGKRAWIFVANFPAGSRASLDLVNRAQASLKEE